jgi:hypothetical protein
MIMVDAIGEPASGTNAFTPGKIVNFEAFGMLHLHFSDIFPSFPFHHYSGLRSQDKAAMEAWRSL